MESFKNMMPEQINVVRDGNEKEINAIDLVVGDIVKIVGGDKVRKEGGGETPFVWCCVVLCGAVWCCVVLCMVLCGTVWCYMV